MTEALQAGRGRTPRPTRARPARLGNTPRTGRRARGRLPRRVPRLGRRCLLRRVHRRTDRRDLRLPRRRHRHHPVDLDRAARQTTPTPGGLTGKGTKGKRARKVPIVEEIRPLVAQASCPPAPIRTPACSRARAADVSPPPSCATPHTGTTWSPSSATSTCAATTSGTPD